MFLSEDIYTAMFPSFRSPQAQRRWASHVKAMPDGAIRITAGQKVATFQPVVTVLFPKTDPRFAIKLDRETNFCVPD
jgi:hypothetical protein